jgi:hypothetical protein
VRGICEKVRDAPDQPAGEILIEQQLHSATRLPTRVAYSKIAGKSAGSNSG